MTALVLLASCTGGTPEATESSTATVVVTPTPIPTPTPSASADVTVKPSRPAALDEPPSVDGAVEVGTYFQLLFPYVFATGDLSDWNTLSHPDCLYCAGVTSDVQTMFQSGNHTVGGAFDVTKTSGGEVDPGAWYTVTVHLVQSPSETVNSQGGVVESFPETKSGVVDLAVIWSDGAWRIREATPTADAQS